MIKLPLQEPSFGDTPFDISPSADAPADDALVDDTPANANANDTLGDAAFENPIEYRDKFVRVLHAIEKSFQ